MPVVRAEDHPAPRAALGRRQRDRDRTGPGRPGERLERRAFPGEDVDDDRRRTAVTTELGNVGLVPRDERPELVGAQRLHDPLGGLGLALDQEDRVRELPLDERLARLVVDAGLDRQPDRERAPLAELARDRDRAAVELDEPLRDRETEARSVGLAVTLGRELLEVPEETPHVLVSDPDARVLDHDLEGRPRLVRGDAHSSAGCRELDRVRDQIEEAPASCGSSRPRSGAEDPDRIWSAILRFSERAATRRCTLSTITER